MVVVCLMALCKERNTWSQQTREAVKKLSKVFFLMVRLNRKLCIFLCTKCTDAFFFSAFLFFSSKSRSYTHQQLFAKKCFRVLSFVCCAPLNADCCCIIWKCWIGSKKKTKKVALSVEPMSRILKVCADYIKFVQLAAQLLHQKKIKKNALGGNRVPFKLNIFQTWMIMESF